MAELLEQFDLTAAARKPLSTYSGGMRRRLDLAMTLVGSPRVIFLDEPTTGLDPRSRRTMWQIIRELAAAGVTILLTTQYLDEADQLADRVAVLDLGAVVAEGTPAELKAVSPAATSSSTSTRRTRCARRRAAAGGRPRHRPARPAVPATGASTRSVSLLDQLHDARIDVEGLAIHTPDLDDVFFAVTGPRPRSPTQTPNSKQSAAMTTLAYTRSDSATCCAATSNTNSAIRR